MMARRIWRGGALAPGAVARAGADQTVEVLVDDEPVRALPGQSVAAVLFRRGRLSWRTNPVTGERRGPYCGMGVCFECELTVDGLPDVRACVTGVRSGMRIDSSAGAVDELRQPRLPYLPLLPDSPEPGPGDARGPTACDVVVVGGGPAGLCAALELRRAGADVVLVEEGDELGGQYYRRRSAAVAAVHGDYRPEGSRLVADVRASGATCLTGTTAWGVGDDGRTLLCVDNASGLLVEVKGRACIIATGAFERAMPFPGWEMPGVVSPGYALHLAHIDAVALGRRVVVAGSGPFLLVAACAVLEAGGGVAAVVEHNRPYRPSLASSGTLRYPARLAELIRYLTLLARHRVPLLQGARVLAAEGSARVERVTIGPSGTAGRVSPSARSWRRTIELDALAVGYGFRPSTELLQLLGAEGRHDDLGDFYPRVDRSGRTSVGGLYAAGEVSGIAGATASRARGTVAASAALADLGLVGSSSETARLAETELPRHDRFAGLVATLFPVRAEDYHAIPDGTIVCRCEGVFAADIRLAASLSWNDVSSTKAFTRAGMGPCQSRLCAAALCSLFTEVSGRAARPPSPAIPIKPLPWTTLRTGHPHGSGPLR